VESTKPFPFPSNYVRVIMTSAGLFSKVRRVDSKQQNERNMRYNTGKVLSFLIYSPQALLSGVALNTCVELTLPSKLLLFSLFPVPMVGSSGHWNWSRWFVLKRTSTSTVRKQCIFKVSRKHLILLHVMIWSPCFLHLAVRKKAPHVQLGSPW
jgi:hypothetical protein